MEKKLAALSSLTKNDWLVWSFVCFDLLVIFPTLLAAFGFRIGIWYVLVAAILGNVTIAMLARRRAAINTK